MLNKNEKTESQCNCGGSFKYLLKGANCRTENIVYRTTVNSVLETRFYIGLCLTQFRFIYANHKKYFIGGVYENDIELSKYVCSLKRRNIDHEISWGVIKWAHPIADGKNLLCRLCLKVSTKRILCEKFILKFCLFSKSICLTSNIKQKLSYKLQKIITYFILSGKNKMCYISSSRKLNEVLFI